MSFLAGMRKFGKVLLGVANVALSPTAIGIESAIFPVAAPALNLAALTLHHVTSIETQAVAAGQAGTGAQKKTQALGAIMEAFETVNMFLPPNKQVVIDQGKVGAAIDAAVAFLNASQSIMASAEVKDVAPGA